MDTQNTLKYFYEHLDEFLDKKTAKTYFVVYDKTEVNYGDENDCNVEYCQEHNIPCYQIKRSAGCCVNSKGNINIADIREKKYGFIETQFSKDLAEYLKEKGLNVEINRNDILIDGYKVASCGGMALEPNFDWVYTCFQISINQDIETIKNVCKKEMVKIPKGLGDYGVTTEELLNWCKKWVEGVK